MNFYILTFMATRGYKRLGFRLGTVYIGSPAVADDVAYLTRLKYELQLMFGQGG